MEPFLDRQLWSDHLELDHGFGPHWNSTQCNLCFQSTGEGKRTILSHFARHLEDVATSSLPRDVESDAESGTESESGQSIRAASTDQTNLDPVKSHDRAIGSASQATLATAARSLENETGIKVPDLDATKLTIKCICGFVGDDGNTVFCEGCGTWQHIICFYQSAEHVPDVHECIDCAPRPMDTGRAAERQRQQRYQSFKQWHKSLQHGNNPAPFGQSGLVHDDQAILGFDTLAPVPAVAVQALCPDATLQISPPLDAVVLQRSDGLYFCSQLGCDATYSRISDCRRHLKKHNGPFFRCKQRGCGMEFYRFDKLRAHMQQGHRLENTDAQNGSLP
jgi:hypothetical protein